MDEPAVMRFSTAALPKSERLPIFREMFGRGVAKMEITPLEENYWAEIELRSLPGTSVMWGGNSPHRFERMHDPAQGDDDLLMVWATGPARGLFRHLGKEITMHDGPAVLMSCADKATVENAGAIRHVTLKIQRSALQPLLPQLDDALMRPIAPETDALQLLKSYVATFRGQSYEPRAELQNAMAAHIHDLVALAAGATRDAAALSRHRGLRAARLDAAKKRILARLGDSRLSVGEIATSQAVTPRYVQMLFEEEGTTFSAFVLAERLSRVYRRLSDPRLADRSIGAIAFDAGFGDLSYFNRAFRRAFGEAPTDTRHRALQSDEPHR